MLGRWNSLVLACNSGVLDLVCKGSRGGRIAAFRSTGLFVCGHGLGGWRQRWPVDNLKSSGGEIVFAEVTLIRGNDSSLIRRTRVGGPISDAWQGCGRVCLGTGLIFWLFPVISGQIGSGRWHCSVRLLFIGRSCHRLIRFCRRLAACHAGVADTFNCGGGIGDALDLVVDWVLVAVTLLLARVALDIVRSPVRSKTTTTTTVETMAVTQVSGCPGNLVSQPSAHCDQGGADGMRCWSRGVGCIDRHERAALVNRWLLSRRRRPVCGSNLAQAVVVRPWLPTLTAAGSAFTSLSACRSGTRISTRVRGS